MDLTELAAAGAFSYGEELVIRGWNRGAVSDALALRFPTADLATIHFVGELARNAVERGRELEAQGSLTGPQLADVPVDPLLPADEYEATILVIVTDPATGKQTRFTHRTTFGDPPDAAELSAAGELVMQQSASKYTYNPATAEVLTEVLALYRG